MTKGEQMDKLRALNVQRDALFEALVIYYQTVLSTSKFVSQRQHCRELLIKLNPAWCQGYFKKSKTKK